MSLQSDLLQPYAGKLNSEAEEAEMRRLSESAKEDTEEVENPFTWDNLKQQTADIVRPAVQCSFASCISRCQVTMTEIEAACRRGAFGCKMPRFSSLEDEPLMTLAVNLLLQKNGYKVHKDEESGVFWILWGTAME